MVTISNDDIRKNIPNILAAGKGEKDIAEKISAYLDISKEFFYTDICPEDVELSDFQTSLAKRIITTDAMARACHSLDVVLTPNGFGVVSNSTVAPASKERMENFRKAMVLERDKAIDCLWKTLHEDQVFYQSKPYTLIGTTVFQDLSFSTLIGEDRISYDTFAKCYDKIRRIQEHMAEEAVSSVVMNFLVKEIWEGRENNWSVVRMIRQYIIDCFVHPEIHNCMDDIVQNIRTNPALKIMWLNTTQSKIWGDFSFENDKKKGGFWL